MRLTRWLASVLTGRITQTPCTRAEFEQQQRDIAHSWEMYEAGYLHGKQIAAEDAEQARRRA